MTPTEKHRETAAAVATKAIGGCLFETAENWTAQKDWATEVIASALANAEREGMKRAAEIVDRLNWPTTNTRDPMDAAQEAAVNQVCTDIRSAILSEAGEGE